MYILQEIANNKTALISIYGLKGMPSVAYFLFPYLDRITHHVHRFAHIDCLTYPLRAHISHRPPIPEMDYKTHSSLNTASPNI